METPGQPANRSLRLVPAVGPGANKRQHDRIEIDLPARLYIFGTGGEPPAEASARVRDVSRSGCRIAIGRMIHPGSSLITVIETASTGRTVRFGVVRNCEYQAGFGHAVGIEFQPVPEHAYHARSLLQTLSAAA